MIDERFFHTVDRHPQSIEIVAARYWVQALSRHDYVIAVFEECVDQCAHDLPDDDAHDLASAFAYRVNQQIGRQAAAAWGVSR